MKQRGGFRAAAVTPGGPSSGTAPSAAAVALCVRAKRCVRGGPTRG